MRGSYFWLDMTRLYTHWLQAFQRKDRFPHYQNSTSLSAFGFILKDFFFWKPMSVNARVVLLVGHDSLHDNYNRINEKTDSHIVKIRRAFQRSVPFWKFFGNRCRLMWVSYFWLDTTRLYTSHVEFGTLWVWVVCNGHGRRGHPIPLSNNDMQTKV